MSFKKKRLPQTVSAIWATHLHVNVHTRFSMMVCLSRKCREVSSRMPRCLNLGKSWINVLLTRNYNKTSF